MEYFKIAENLQNGDKPIIEQLEGGIYTWVNIPKHLSIRIDTPETNQADWQALKDNLDATQAGWDREENFIKEGDFWRLLAHPLKKKMDIAANADANIKAFQQDLLMGSEEGIDLNSASVIAGVRYTTGQAPDDTGAFIANRILTPEQGDLWLAGEKVK